MIMTQELLAACAAQGYRTDTAAGTVSGVESGIAFQLRAATGELEMSVNIPADHLSKLQGRIASARKPFAGVAVAHHHYGVLVTLPDSSGLTAEESMDYIRIAAAEATKLIGVAYDDKYEKDGEPVSAYIRGFFGALLGAVVGIIPWTLASSLLHISFWFLGALISVASFYGYCRFRGAHHTSYAITLIVIFSLAVMVLPGGIESAVFLLKGDEAVSVWTALSISFSPSNLLAQLPSMGFGLLANIAGLFAIRGRVLSYTHESQYLRRGRKRK